MEWRVQLEWSRFAAFVLIAAGLSFWLSRHVPADVSVGAWVVLALAAIAGVVVTKSRASNARDDASGIARRERGADTAMDPLAPAVHPYRERVRRATLAPVPTLSARTTALVVGVVLIVSGVLLPISLKLPRWVELELVLTVWWATSSIFLAVLLHRGTRIREDHAFRMRWDLPTLGTEAKEAKRDLKGWSWADGADPGCADGEGCVGVVVGVVLAVVAVAAAWFVIELAFPAVFFLLYWLVVKAIARVANDRHGCEGSYGRSLAWGALWATMYTVPLAVVVWGVHVLAASRLAAGSP